MTIVAEALGRVASGPVTLYLVGGATAVVVGWRASTADLDLVFEPDNDALLQAIPALKEHLDINIELASPLDFLPELPGWRERSPFVSQHGFLTVRQFDLYAQVIAKLERGFVQDLRDVDAIVDRGLVEPVRLLELFDAIEPGLFRFPAVDPLSLRAEVERIARPEGSPDG